MYEPQYSSTLQGNSRLAKILPITQYNCKPQLSTYVTRKAFLA